MQNATVFWDKMSKKYSEAAIPDHKGYQLTLTKTQGYLTTNDHVLEVGCGTGSTALLLAEHVGQYTASDLSGKMIEIGERGAREQKIPNLDFMHADVLDPALKAGSYDAVLAFNMLHLLEDPAAAMKSIGALVKPGGVFISKTVCKFGPDTPLKWRLLKMLLPVMQFFGKAPYVNFMEVSALENLIEGGGFKILESGNYPKTHMSRYIVARKT